MFVVEDSIYYDVMRVIACVTGFFVIVLTAWLLIRHRRPTSLRGDREWCAGVIVVATGIVIREAQQFGKSFIVYQLPFFLAFNILILRGIALRATDAYEREHGKHAAD